MNVEDECNAYWAVAVEMVVVVVGVEMHRETCVVIGVVLVVGAAAAAVVALVVEADAWNVFEHWVSSDDDED